MADFEKLQQQENSNSLLKKHLTKDVFNKLRFIQTSRNIKLHDVIVSGKYYFQ